MEKGIRQVGDTRRSIVTQRIHGTGLVEHYRKTVQEMAPVIEHVRHHAHKVNEAPVAGNRNGWGYIGSIPMEIMMDWIRRNNYTVDQFARNEDGCRDKFKHWFLHNRDLKKFRADAHHHRIKRVFA